MTAPIATLNEEDVSRVIEMAWEGRTPFEAIERLFGLAEPQVSTNAKILKIGFVQSLARSCLGSPNQALDFSLARGQSGLLFTSV